ncbi:hypothetical protein [Streptomyces sp. C]|uniref:hypothetical protein n=1 Tax=Streptomyces sp. C TaxID=253839 RepID=UPI0001DEF7C3|nr:hypothetical protein [Streptomyces sp. C]EFL17622.1 predicted protein [Streptomyces sp. C]
MADSDEDAPASGRSGFDAVHKWAATIAAVAALAFSLYNFTELQRKPEIDLSLPHFMRIGMEDDNVQFFVQPTVSARIRTQDVEVIRDAHFDLTGTGALASSKRPVFYWRELGAWNFDAEASWLSYQWSADPAPFIVSQDKPQQPIFLFQADGWNFRAGRYEGKLRLTRTGSRSPLTKAFCIVLSERAAKEIRDGEPSRGIYFFRNDLPRFAASKDRSGCYVRETD